MRPTLSLRTNSRSATRAGGKSSRRAGADLGSTVFPCYHLAARDANGMPFQGPLAGATYPRNCIRVGRLWVLLLTPVFSSWLLLRSPALVQVLARQVAEAD